MIGRKAEEQLIVSFIRDNIASQKSGLLYVCGHPGQGKTELVEQVLFENFGMLDSSMGGTDETVWVLKYNAMRFNSDHSQFLRSLTQDIELIWQQEQGSMKRAKPIK